MKIIDVICSPGKTGFFFDDQLAIKNGARANGVTYEGKPLTEGFNTIRQAGESISVLLVLENGQIAHGDCAAVQYSGAAGRDPLFLAEAFIPFIETHIKPQLIGKTLEKFQPLAEEFDKLIVEGKRLHTAIRYGITQALLDGVAKANGKTMAEIVQWEYGIDGRVKRIPIFTQSGDARYENAEKMIIKKADVLTHALINNVETKLGKSGELLLDYIGWLRNRIMELRTSDDYLPVLHIDVYGTIGLAFDNDLTKVKSYIKILEAAASPFKLRIEGPLDMGNRTDQIETLSALTKILDDEKIGVEIVADEWCNTLEDIKLFVDQKAGHMMQIKTPDLGGVNNIIEAINYCKINKIGAYCGGTCNETDRSAQVCTNIAMACHADQCLAKPGMGVDEGFMIVTNEMNRVLALQEAFGYGNKKA